MVDGEAAAGAAGGTGRDVKARGVRKGAAAPGTPPGEGAPVPGAAGAPAKDAGAEVGDAAPGAEPGEGASNTGGSPRAAC